MPFVFATGLPANQIDDGYSHVPVVGKPFEEGELRGALLEAIDGCSRRRKAWSNWMCNLYSLNKGQDHLRQFFNVRNDETGNIAPLPEIFPKSMAPVVRQDGDKRVMQMMRWGFPPPLNYSRPATPVTNVRNLKTSYWRSWIKPGHRCLVPATSFCEWADSRPKVAHWFALDDSRPLFAFAGIWRLWVGEHRVYAFLTTEANSVVAPVHSKAMPVILATPDECDAWLTAPLADALKLQRPLLDDALRIVAKGEEKPDAWPAADQ